MDANDHGTVFFLTQHDGEWKDGEGVKWEKRGLAPAGEMWEAVNPAYVRGTFAVTL
jgi:hypothetical protein